MGTRQRYLTAAVTSAAVTVVVTPGTALAGPHVHADDIRNVPDASGEWYRQIVEWAGSTPPAVQTFMEHFTELGIVLLAATWALVLWRTRRKPARPMAITMAGGVAVVLAYGLSEWSKTYLDTERPCRTFPDLKIIANECPPTGDWSFPSNHSTIAAALLVAIILVSWRLGLLALPISVLAGFSRVFVGVHYPHDVVAGFLIGAVVTATATALLTRPTTKLVTKLREHPTVGRLLTTGRPAHPRPDHTTGNLHHSPR